MLKLLFITQLIFGASNVLTTEFKTMEGKMKSLNSYDAKAYLVVNIATRCGYTGQLEGLEKVYQAYKDKGLMVIGFPSNDFGGQTPESNKNVKKFCKLNYGVNFPLATKNVVFGDKKSKFFKALLSSSSDSSEIKWNFEKFLIDNKGKVVKRFKSSQKPATLNSDIERALGL